jgi:uncharacterized protein YndB with AHSA1/START domain
MIADQIEREIVIDAPVDKVWTTLTSAEHLGKWLADSGAEIDLKPGGAVALNWEGYGKVLGRVEKVESQRTFAYRWTNGPAPELTDDNSTLVEFTLSPEGAGTRLRVVESGFLALDLPDDQKTNTYNEHVEGWKSELNELSEYTVKLAA